MPWSNDVLTRTVTGTYVTANGNAAAGKIYFRPTARVLDENDMIILNTASIIVTLDVNGEFSIELPVTDNPKLQPSDWAYEVTVKIYGSAPTKFYMLLPFGDGTSTNIVDTISAGTSADSIGFSSGQTVIRGSTGPTGPTGVTGPTGAGGALGYYGSFYDSTTQSIAVANTAQLVEISDTFGANGISLSGLGRIVIANPGTYSLTFSLQFANYDNVARYIDVWLKYMGSDYPNSATRFDLSPRKSASVPSYVVGSVTLIGTSVNNNDYVEIWAASDSTDVKIISESSVAGPGIPSVILAVSQVMYTQIPSGASGSFTSQDGKTITVSGGVITSIV